MNKIKDFIKGHKVLCILGGILLTIALVIAFILIFVGTPKKEEVKTLRDKVIEDAQFDAEIDVTLRYEVSYSDAHVYTAEELEDGTWEVYGKIYARDNFGDNYTGKFEGVCTVDENEEPDCDVDVDTLYKDR